MKSKANATVIAVLLTLLLVVPVFGGVAHAAGTEQAQLAVPILVVNTSFLNIRTGPGVQYTTLVTVVGGTELPTLGVADDLVWYYVATPVGNGWANIEFLIPRGDFRYVPRIDPVVPAQVVANTPLTIGLPGSYAQQGGGTVAQTSSISCAPERFRAMINVDSVNLRNAPADDGGVITILYRNDPVDYAITGRSLDNRNVEWLAIAVPNVGIGWVEGNKIVVRLSGRYRTVLTIVGETVGVTSNMTGETTGQPVLVAGSEAFLLGVSGQLLNIELGDGRTGFIPFNAAVVREGTPTDGLYETCGGAGGIVVNPPDGQGGGGVVSPPIVVPALQPPIAIVNTGNLNIRSGPGASYISIGVVPGGTRLTILGYTSDQVWYWVESPFGQGWINSEFTILRGNLNNAALVRDAYSTGGAGAAVG